LKLTDFAVVARYLVAVQVKIIRAELQNWGYETLGRAKPSLIEQMHTLLNVGEKGDDKMRSGTCPLEN
jgi:hypothetical protein